MQLVKRDGTNALNNPTAVVDQRHRNHLAVLRPDVDEEVQE